MWPFSSHEAAVLAALDRSLAVIEFDPTGKILTANANFLKVMGYELSEIVGKHHSMFVDPKEVQTPAYTAFWRDLQAGRYMSAEFRRIAKGGRSVWIQGTYNPLLDKSGKVYRVVKFATDVTDRKLEDVKVQGEIAAINRAQAVISFEPDGTIIEANENFEKALGYKTADIVGKHHSMFVTPEERNSPSYKKFWEDLRAGQFKSDEFHRVGKGGRDVFLQATYNPIFDGTGQLVRVTKFATDITAVMERRRKRQAAQTEINRELAEVADMIARSNAEAAGANSTAGITASNVQSVAAGAEELVSSVGEISRQVSVALSVSQDAVTQAESATQVVSGLATAAQKIDQVVELINTIAGQTNLLALNATIEAARAGEMGKGFAVVAQEVKQLAAQTSKATEEIASEIAAVQTISSKAVQSIDGITAIITRINDISSSIAAAVEEQAAVTQNMSGSMHTAASGVEDIAKALADISSSTQSIDEAANKLQRAASTLA
ncbi:PAS domain-containing methyl-accepting chemotaxis protein [Pleomorphomonas sp. JP5]|uniref:methyl-accepting chemotaxis protein n=1 Tax=Pleomorphomonas sp. JP5 TaxID=2942998 RepID=UPI00204345DD|nr:PAS domain-containing methyl-accepting chemotaxis protein [Pleomorphomonas sp. JP5]MCM5558372.1 PAS domain-containing methyl-accepting chemotaxis protein [Pleomorphomonas sp. JP5]